MGDWITREIDADRVWRHIRWLTAHAPSRISGTPDMEQAASYVYEQLQESFEELQESGLEVERCSYQGYTSIPGPASLCVEGSSTWSCPAVSVAFTRPLENVTLDLVDMGRGDPIDYHRRDVRGKAVLVDAHGSGTPERARTAAAQGAAAVVLATWPAPLPGVITFRAMKGVWGLPGPDSLSGIPEIAAVCVSAGDAQRLRGLIGQSETGAIAVRISAMAETGWMPLEEVTARIAAPGAEPGMEPGAKPGAENEDFVLVHGHLDAWCPGVTDNASGNALMLELARALARHRGRLRRSVVLAFWDGHEIAEATGSSFFVARNWDLLRDHCMAHVNVDSPGVLGTSRFRADSSPELRTFQHSVHALPGLLPASYGSMGRTADQSFVMAGVPGLLCFPDGDPPAAGGVERKGEIPFFWWSHTDQDTLDKFSREAFFAQTRVISHYLDGLLTPARWPIDFAPVLAGLRSFVAEAVAVLRGTDLGESLGQAGESLAEVERLYLQASQGGASHRSGREYNPLLRDMSRTLLPVVGTVSGKYSQDRYGDPRYQLAWPGLAHLTLLTKTVAGEQEPYLGPAMMERNRLADALLSVRSRLRCYLQESGCS